MSHTTARKFVVLLGGFLCLWLVLRYLFPLFLPFLVGTGLALGAEPIVSFLCKQLRLPRGISALVGVSIAFSMVALVLLILAALLVQELGSLAGILPDLANMIRLGLNSLEDWLLELAARAPDGVEPLLTQGVLELFSGGSALLDRVTAWVLNLATNILGRLPGGALGLGTAILSAFMISAKLPRIRDWLGRILPAAWKARYLPALRGIRKSLAGWLKAQIRLAGITFVIVILGFFLLRIPYAPLWAALVALVDAIPMLGTGTALVPWALVSLLQGDRIRAVGLLAIYAVAALTRSVLEPRLVGRQLGLDPLITLVALYLGFRLWGVAGMLLSPMIAVAAVHLAAPPPEEQPKPGTE